MTPAVQAFGLEAGYGRRPIWAGANFALDAGEFVAVLGPNGAGKSTLLRLLLGLLEPRSGRLEVLGRAPRRGHPQIGYVPQRRSLDADVGLRGADMVRLGIDGHRWGPGLGGRGHPRWARVHTAISDVGAVGYAERPIGQLSGGELQRLLLAQALVGEPRMLLLDEPLANLDVRNQVAMAQLVGRLARERHLTVLLVAHDVNPLLPVVDRVMYIARGGVAIGTPGEVITSERLSALYGADVEVLEDRRGRLFVVGLDSEESHPHDHD